ncbi:MAG: ArsR/SmtB family transcription factor, partial [Candidatus Hodarchaeota archaeon]
MVVKTTTQQEERFVDNLIQTLRNPTRASIFYRLVQKPESTATEISRDLGEDVDVVYYHLKLLRKAGLISDPRVVAQKTYVEKFYSIRPDFKEKFIQSIGSFKARKKELSSDEFREMQIALLTVIQSIIVSSMKRLKKVDSTAIDKIKDEKKIESKIIFCSKERYDQLLVRLRKVAKS